MGSSVSCDDTNPCTTILSSTIINLSDDLIMRFDGIEPLPQKKASVTCCDLSTVDDVWYEKLQCIEDSHSRAYGLTYRALNRYITAVDNRIKERHPRPCGYSKIINCYERNKDCPIKCAGEVSQFINCIDARRLEKLKVIRDAQLIMQRQQKIDKIRRSIG